MGEIERKEPNIETKSEHIPTLEKIYEGFREVIKKKFEIVRELKKGDVFYLVDVRTPGDNEGEIDLYTYMLKGDFTIREDGKVTYMHQTPKTEIQVTYFMNEADFKNNNACGGKNPLARYLDDGTWEIVKD